ncbi:protein phosphatase CheZ [Skermanella pratensis]|uniref:protein phosphatase CheZ n=1 Tax=Skermanella pratensis TaxID=2233999 RepID=UPI0013010326|nr:protein phosphatase CheZ [Skermanella pratensis]
MTVPELLDLTELDYLSMEEALSSSARGRAFLRMRDRRTRVVSVDDWRRLAGKLEEQVDRLRGVEAVAVTAAQPIEMVTDAAGVTTDRSTHLRILRQELQEMSSYIQQTRSEIAALRPADAGANRIMAATGELDAIVTATERATTEILNAAERIQEFANQMHRAARGEISLDVGDVANDIEIQIMEIMTACSFQDITGQRTTKVVNTLRYIEQRVNTMIEIWGVDRAVLASADAAASHRKMNDDRPDAHLLNGPALGDGVDQATIDALFDSISFDAPPPQPAYEPPSPPRPAPAPPAPPPPAPPPVMNGSAEINQSDIDKLFG